MDKITEGPAPACGAEKVPALTPEAAPVASDADYARLAAEAHAVEDLSAEALAVLGLAEDVSAKYGTPLDKRLPEMAQSVWVIRHLLALRQQACVMLRSFAELTAEVRAGKASVAEREALRVELNQEKARRVQAEDHNKRLKAWVEAAKAANN